jgi:lipopolysaccharide biosynthesis glycosyltransferase
MNKLAIVGNGISRKFLTEEISEFEEIWVCNKGAYEYSKFPTIKRVYSVHSNVLQSLSNESFILSNEIILVGREELPGLSQFKEDKGWSSGNQAILDALLEGYEEIYLYGFDFGGEDIYQTHSLEGSNFKKQYDSILNDSRFDANEKLILRYPEKRKETIFVTLMDDNFFEGFKGFFRSLKETNPNFDYTCIILDNGLSESIKEKMKGIYSNLLFKTFEKDVYSFPIESTESRLLSTYYKLEFFNPSLYSSSIERSIFVDMDILVRGSLDELVHYPLQDKILGACRQFNLRKDGFIDDINSGVMVLDVKQLSYSLYETLVSYCSKGFYLPDQEIINSYFLKENKYLTYLPKKFNVEKRMFHSKNFKEVFDNSILLHYVGIKPWQEESKNDLEYKEVYDLWPVEKENKKKCLTHKNLEDLNYSIEELKYLINQISETGGSLYGKGISYQLSSTCGKLISILKAKPLTSERDNTWLFYIGIDDSLLVTYINPTTEEEFSSLLKGKKVIFVGPSPIMRNRKLGDFIDSFDIVVRTNNMINTLLSNPDFDSDFGTRTDILYVNVTYERDAFNEWKITDWAKKGLQIICKLMNSYPKEDLPFRWRNIPNRLKDVPPPTLFIGTRLIHDLLSFDIKSLYITGIDAYTDISDITDGKNEEYIDGYLPEFTLRQRKNRIGKPVSLHDKHRDAKLILDFAKDPRVTIDPVCKEKIEKVAYGKN